MNSLAWLALLVWVGIPFLVIMGASLLWRRSKTILQKGMVVIASAALLCGPALVSIGVKWRFDHQVRELCAGDGGVRVYETVKLAPELVDKYGVIRIPDKERAKPSDAYYYESSMRYLKSGKPEMWRLHFMVFRRLDNKLLGEAISYARRGGDVPGPWHESSFGCPENVDISDLKKRIFITAE
jgi:hypothetical protein